MQPILTGCVQALDRLAAPGETTLTWMSLNLDAYIACLLAGVRRLEDTVCPLSMGMMIAPHYRRTRLHSPWL